VRLSNEQRTQIRETVLARSDAPRVERSRISFALVTGTVVPSYVRVVEVPDTLVTIDPAWRGDMYFVAGDDIVIVDHSRRIVATIPAGSETQSSAVTTERSGTVTSERSGTMNLSRDEIRQVQLMLNQKGFNIGEPDGVMGPRTKEALMAFQRREGFQASGQIDQQTMAALGMSGTMGRQGGQAQPSTTGERGPAGMNEPNANQRNLNEPGVNQQGTATGQPTGQNRSMTQTPQGQGQSSTNVPSQSHPSTTGQSNVPAQAPATSNPAGSPSMQQRQSR
jgi:peptidoglycan hydrolase-like protein with peptidoglycan-binding domain